jgi:hypothetical protein
VGHQYPNRLGFAHSNPKLHFWSSIQSSSLFQSTPVRTFTHSVRSSYSTTTPVLICPNLILYSSLSSVQMQLQQSNIDSELSLRGRTARKDRVEGDGVEDGHCLPIKELTLLPGEWNKAYLQLSVPGAGRRIWTSWRPRGSSASYPPTYYPS